MIFRPGGTRGAEVDFVSRLKEKAESYFVEEARLSTSEHVLLRCHAAGGKNTGRPVCL
jgi:hypothetical protein